MLGALVASTAFTTTATGYRQLLAWARGFGVLRRAGVEGTGSYSAALTQHLRRQNITVVEVNRPDRAARRRQGKTDAIDATAAAHTALSGRANTTAKTADGPVEMLRMFKLARTSAIKSRTQAINQLKAVIIGADPPLRETLTGLTDTAQIRYCASLPDTPPRDVPTATTYTLRRLAQRIQALTQQARELQLQITTVITAHTPHLLQRTGIGPDSAATLLITAGDNPDRMNSEASFATLCSSGKTRRRRLNHGGDRRANAALYRIALTRSRCDQRTRDYLDRRTAQGMTRREAIRCAKRYAAREIYNLIRPLNLITEFPRTT